MLYLPKLLFKRVLHRWLYRL